MKVISSDYSRITCPLQKQSSQDNVVIIVTMLQAEQSVIWILAGARDFYVLQNVQTSFGAQPSSFSMSTMVLSMGGGDKVARAWSWPLASI
jgi:hypothetical protein